ncbi:MAG: A24 family peptidase [Pseudomonadota bacterium]
MTRQLNPRWLALGFSAACLCGVAGALFIADGPFRLIGAGLACWLSWASYVDAQRYLLLDIHTLPLALAGLGLAAAGLGPSLISAAGGAALGYGVFWAVSALYRRLRGVDGLGLGDAKLMCAAGAWCGALQLPFVVLLGSVSALAAVTLFALSGAVVTGSLKLPFGPFLSFGFFVTWMVFVAADHPGFTAT